MGDDGLDPLARVFAVLVSVVAGVTATVWAGAALAAAIANREALGVGLSTAAEAAGGLWSDPGDPGAAWPESVSQRLPGPFLYWVCTAVVALVAIAALLALVSLFGRRRWGLERRHPLGVSPEAGLAVRRDLAPLLLRGPVPGRFILGRFGRSLVATEWRGRPGRRLSWRTRRRMGDRGAVALIGPSRSGKTTAAIAGILEWEGPALLSSVKGDLLGDTIRWRQQLGLVRVFDPVGQPGLVDPGLRIGWSPVRHAGTTEGAQAAARSLIEAAPRSGVDGFWMAQAEILLSALLFVARFAKRDMGAVCGWVLSADMPDDHGRGEVEPLLQVAMEFPDPVVAAAAEHATEVLMGIWGSDERTRSSVYSTARTVVWSWSAPLVAESSRGQCVDLDWLMSACHGANTLYLSAPPRDQKRLSSAFGGLFNDLMDQVFARVAETGEPLDPPLLVVLDEAGNTPLENLPEYASTLAGLGVLLVTIWQSKAQIDAAYGVHSGTVLTNHLSKVFYPGMSDPDGLALVATLCGDEEVGATSESRDLGIGTRRGSIQESTTRIGLTPANVVRQMRPGEALLIHGTLPPAHIKVRPWYRDRRLRARSEGVSRWHRRLEPVQDSAGSIDDEAAQLFDRAATDNVTATSAASADRDGAVDDSKTGDAL